MHPKASSAVQDQLLLVRMLFSDERSPSAASPGPLPRFLEAVLMTTKQSHQPEPDPSPAQPTLPARPTKRTALPWYFCSHRPHVRHRANPGPPAPRSARSSACWACRARHEARDLRDTRNARLHRLRHDRCSGPSNASAATAAASSYFWAAWAASCSQGVSAMGALRLPNDPRARP